MSNYVDVDKLINTLSGTISVRQLDLIKTAIYDVGIEDTAVAVDEFAKYCIGQGEDGIIHTIDIPGYVMNFKEAQSNA